jgi:hypothetical protein
MTGGLARADAAYEALLAAGGFSLSRVVPTTAGLNVIAALPAWSAACRWYRIADGKRNQTIRSSDPTEAA